MYNDNDAEESVGLEWNKIKQSITQSATDNIGIEKEGRNADWFGNDCLRFVEKKNEARKIKLQHETRSKCEIYNNYRREANRKCRKKKREIINEQLQTIQELNSQN